MVEVHGTSGFSVPLGSDGKVMISGDYLEFIVSLANLKMKENADKLASFKKAFVL